MGWKKFNSRRKVRKKSIFLRKWFLIFIGTGLFICLVAFVCMYVWASKFKDRAEKYDMALINEIEQPSMIYDREDSEVGRIFSENRDPCKVEDVSQLFIDTLIAAEDARFFSHGGYDVKGITRVIWDMVKNKGKTQSGGASTLTQQLARNAYHLQDEAKERDESTKERKVVEIFLAQRIEKEYTKHQILEFYINRVNFGGGFHGVRSASLGFFGKEPKDLGVHECASLVGAIRNPAFFSPSSWNKDENGKRVQGLQNLQVRNRVLDRMAIEQMITESECEEYKLRPLGLNPTPIQRGTSHFHDRVAEKFEKLLKDVDVSDSVIAKGGFKIFTTIDKDIQEELEKQIDSNLLRIESRPGYEHPKHKDYVRTEDSKPAYLQAAGLAIDHHTGEVLGYVGGRDFVHSQYDFIESGKKPMGTAFFPFIYASALEAGHNSSEKLIDEAMDNRQVMIDGVEGVLGEWGHEVMSPRYEGSISMRRSLAASKIAATVRLGRKVGLSGVWDTAKKFGFEKPDGRLLNKTLLGSEESSLSSVVKSYGVFPNAGKKVEKLVWITKIEDAHGKELYLWDGIDRTEQVISDASAFLIHTMLEDSLKKGSGEEVFHKNDMGRFIGGGKTGTTSDFSNHWFVGYNGRVTCGLWAGFYDGSRKEIYQDAFSKDTVMPIWIDTMKKAESKLSRGVIKMPDDILKMKICKHSGMLATKGCEEYVHNVVTGEKEHLSTSYDEYFHRTKKPRGACPIHGASLGNFHDGVQLGGEMSPIERMNTIPIKPKSPTLVGKDPYHAEASVYAAKRQVTIVAGRGLNSMNFELTEDEKSRVLIPMDQPTQMDITE